MKLFLKNIPSLSEIEVHLLHAEPEPELSSLLSLLRSFDATILCDDENKQVSVRISDIFYVESIDKKTYIYTKNNVHSISKRLFETESLLRKFKFCQISKSCIVNVAQISSFKPLLNSRLEATLKNGEKLIVSRKYIPALKEMLEEVHLP